MDGGLRTPLLDFFRRGEVARDIRLLAAQGAVAPRPLEQLGLLMLLTGGFRQRDARHRRSHPAMLPADVLASFIARADAPTELREFFLKRGVPGDADARARRRRASARTPMRPTWACEAAAEADGADRSRSGWPT